MTRNARILALGVAALLVMAGCSSTPPSGESKKAPVELDKIQGKAQVMMETVGTGDAALNPGGPAVYLWVGTKRYRLFSRTLMEIQQGREYVVEGINAQRLIDEIGDPNKGKGGYPLRESCERVVTSAWTGLPFDGIDANAGLLRERVARYPARPVFLVVKIEPAPAKEGAEAEAKKEAEERDAPSVTVPGEKHSASLIEGATTYTAPLWEPAGRTLKCKVVIDREGKVSDLETGAQLCEAVPWSTFRYKPMVQGGRPVRVKTEVEIRYDPLN